MESLEEGVKKQAEDIIDLRARNRTLERVVKNLNFGLSKTTLKFNAEKANMKKTHKKEIKHWRKELGLERSLKIKLEKKFEQKPKVSPPIPVASQTPHHPDIPYQVASPLPPIFSSELRRKTPKLHFISRSHPDLNTILWCKPDTDFIDEAEEALNEQYDREVQEFYSDQRDRLKAFKQENQVICTLDSSSEFNNTETDDSNPEDF